MNIEPIYPLLGVIIGWALKSLADYFASRKADIRTYNNAIFYILRVWKALTDYERGTNFFRSKKPNVEEFEPWRAILAEKFIESLSRNKETLSEAVKVLSKADPVLATRLDNMLKNVIQTFQSDMAEIAATDEERYAQLIYNQDYIVDLTLHDLKRVASKLAFRSGVSQQLSIWWYFRSINKGTENFNNGMEQQKEMLNKVTNP